MHLNTVDFRAGGRDVTRALSTRNRKKRHARALGHAPGSGNYVGMHARLEVKKKPSH